MEEKDFTKAEEALAEAVRKATVAKLLNEADAAAGKPTAAPRSERTSIVIGLKHQLKRLRNMDPNAYKKMGLQRKELEALLEKTVGLDDAIWQNILDLKSKVDAYIKEWKTMHPEFSDEQLLARERRLNVNKSLTTNKKWLPLR